MKKLLLFSSLIIILVAGLLGACAKPAPAPAPTPAPTPAPQPQAHAQFRVEMLTTEATGLGYNMGLALGDLLNKFHPWLRGTARVTGGSGENMEIIRVEPDKRKTAVAWVPEASMYASDNGITPYVKEKFTGLKALFVPYPSVGSFVTLDPNIKTLADLRGKKVAIYAKTIAANLAVESLFLGMGQDFKDSVTVEMLGFGPMQQGLADGRFDAAIGSATNMPAGEQWPLANWLVENMNNPRGHLIDIPKEAIDKGAAAGGYPNLYYSVPANALKPRHPAIGGRGHLIAWAVHESMDEDVAYELTKFMWENRDKFVPYNAVAKSWLPDTVATWPFGVEGMHPGAVRYFKEAGIPVGRPS